MNLFIEIRVLLGKTRCGIAKELGIHPQTWTNIETRGAGVKPEIFQKLQRLIGKTVFAQLLERHEER
jgi:DNA-binding XRE family transcriptional regulator